MRIAAFVGSIVLANVITLGGIALFILADPHHLEPVIWLAVVPLMLFVYGPVLLGTFTSYWDAQATPDSRRYFRRWLIGVGAVQALAAASIVLFAVLTRAHWWLPVAFVVGGGALDLLALRIGPHLRRREEARWPTEPVWVPVTRQQIVRWILLTAGVFLAVLVVGGIAFSVLFASIGTRRHATDGTGIMFAGEFALLAAAIVCIVLSLRLSRQIREQVTRDIGVLRRLAKVVVRAKPIALTDDEQVLAARYAAVISVTLPFTLAYVLLLYAGLGLQQLVQLGDGVGAFFPIFYLALLTLVLLVGVPLYTVRIRRTRTYAREHAALLAARR